MTEVVKENTDKNKFCVGTHNGIFHCDEVLATAMIAILTNDVNVIRSRDIDFLIENTDVLVDVGKDRFDHHQKEGNGQRENGAKYASAGLIWRAFRGRIVKTVIKKANIERDFTLDEIIAIADDVDKCIIQEIDKEDNGQKPYSHPFQFVSSFLPNWNDPKGDYDKKFEECVAVVQKILEQSILKLVEKYLYPREYFWKDLGLSARDSVFNCDNILATALSSIIDDKHLVAKDDNFRYANAKLAWKAYGKSIVKSLLKKPLSEADIDKIIDYIDRNIIQCIDGENSDQIAKNLFKFIPLYSSVQDKNIDYDEKLNECVDVTKEVMMNVIEKSISICLAPKETKKRLENPKTHIDNILVIPAQTFPWVDSLVKHNEEEPNSPIDFVVFPYPAGGYALQCVPPINDKFAQRIPLPKEWSGLDSELPKVSGIASATFCHQFMFFARAEKYEDIMRMCQIATKIHDEKRSSMQV